MADANVRMAWYIYDMIADDAWNYLINSAGWDNNYNLQVQWGPTSVVGTWYNGILPWSLGTAGTRMSSCMNIAHFVMDKTYITYPPSPNCNPHSWGAHSSLGCGWTEGWANFLQGAIQNSPAYVDTEDQSINYSLEPPAAWADHPEDEGAVAAGLWDVYDSGAEFFDTIVNGIDGAAHNGIWDVVYNLDPVNVQGFWDGLGDFQQRLLPGGLVGVQPCRHRLRQQRTRRTTQSAQHNPHRRSLVKCRFPGSPGMYRAMDAGAVWQVIPMNGAAAQARSQM